MTFPPPERGSAAAPSDGRDRSNGRPELDPAHGGPLPRATLPELVGRLINDFSDLADRQIELAKQEVGEAKDEAIDAVKRISIGAGIAAAAALLLVIWAWTAFIWFFNWLAGLIVFETPIGQQSVAWLVAAIVAAPTGWVVGSAFFGRRGGVIGTVVGALIGGLAGLWAGLGWLLGVLVPVAAASLAWRRLIWRGIVEAQEIWPPLPRTRETLKENLEWLRHLRTPGER